MAYERTVWKNREVERPRTYDKVDNPDGTITLLPSEGNIIEAGTPIIAENMNNIEDGIEEALAKADAAFQSASDGKQQIATAISGKGVPASGSDTFPQLATKIGQIETDKTGDATAVASDILSGKTAYARGSKLIGTIPSKGAATITPGKNAQTIAAGQFLSGIQTISGVDVPAANVLTGTTIAGTAGTMPNRGAVTNTITTHNGSYTIPAGYHNGSGKVTATITNLSASNIKKGVSVGGISGTYGPTTIRVPYSSISFSGWQGTTSTSGSKSMTLSLGQSITGRQVVSVAIHYAYFTDSRSSGAGSDAVVSVCHDALLDESPRISGSVTKVWLSAVSASSTSISLNVNYTADSSYFTRMTFYLLADAWATVVVV